MKTIVPDYYPLFRCRAGACRHTCCAGWEIDIDENTRAEYEKLPGPLGERLRANIADGHFVLDSAERCPFLNASGLCDIITEKGDGALCQVCRDHPRFRNFMTGRTEMGVGLTCEAAAELILGRKEPVKLITLDDDGKDEPLTDEETRMLAFRDHLLDLAQNRTESVESRLDAIADEADIFLPERDLNGWTELYLNLERLDPKWTARLESAQACAPAPITDETALEQLLVYLLFRHVLPACEDGDLEGHMAFVLSSFNFIRALGGDITDTARMWSSEIEYSDENIGALIDACYEDNEY